MTKKVLAVYFTQSGQLEDIIDRFTAPLTGDNNVVIEKLRIYPEKDFPSRCLMLWYTYRSHLLHTPSLWLFFLTRRDPVEFHLFSLY